LVDDDQTGRRAARLLLLLLLLLLRQRQRASVCDMSLIVAGAPQADVKEMMATAD
jgi:hypothetical protein